MRSLWTIPSRRYGPQYLRFLLWCVGRHPSRFPEAVRLGIQGFHFEGITREALACRAIRHDSTRVAERFRQRFIPIAEGARRPGPAESGRIRELVAERARTLRRLRRRIVKLGPGTRAAAGTGAVVSPLFALIIVAVSVGIAVLTSLIPAASAAAQDPAGILNQE